MEQLRAIRSFSATHTLITLSSSMVDADERKVDALVQNLILNIQNADKKICGDVFVTSLEYTDSSLLNMNFNNAITNANRVLKKGEEQYGPQVY